MLHNQQDAPSHNGAMDVAATPVTSMQCCWVTMEVGALTAQVEEEVTPEVAPVKATVVGGGVGLTRD